MLQFILNLNYISSPFIFSEPCVRIYKLNHMRLVLDEKTIVDINTGLKISFSSFCHSKMKFIVFIMT